MIPTFFAVTLFKIFCHTVTLFCHKTRFETLRVQKRHHFLKLFGFKNSTFLPLLKLSSFKNLAFFRPFEPRASQNRLGNEHVRSPQNRHSFDLTPLFPCFCSAKTAPIDNCKLLKSAIFAVRNIRLLRNNVSIFHMDHNYITFYSS